MKKLILCSLSILSLNLFASEITSGVIRPEGLFKFSEVKVAQVRDIEVVPEINTQRYDELLKLNYQCQLVANFYRCVKFIKNVELPQSILTKITNESRGKTFEFTLSPMDPTQINESENLNEWIVFDSVQFNGELISEYHYYQLKGSDGTEVQKAFMCFENFPQWPVFVDSKTLFTPVHKGVTTGRFTSRVYELSLFFKK